MANTLYQPIYLQPELTSRDMSVNQIFSCIVDGLTIDSYRIIIYDLSDNSIIYNSNKISLGSNLFNGDTLEITVPANSISNGLECKYTIEYWNGTDTAISYETVFDSATSAVFTINVPSIIESQQYEFIGSYSQDEGVPLREWYFVLYDSNDDKLDESPVFFTGNIAYTFGGFSKNQVYKIRGYLVTRNGEEVVTPLYSFIADYEVPIITLAPTATELEDKTAVRLRWGTLSQVTGVVDGASQYILNFIYNGNYGLHLDDGSSISFDVPIPLERTLHFVFQPDDVLYEGAIIILSNSVTGQYFEVGYRDNRFYSNVSGITNYYNETTLDNKYFIIIIHGLSVTIKEITIGGILVPFWDDTMVWDDTDNWVDE